MSEYPWIIVDSRDEKAKCDRCGEARDLFLPKTVVELVEFFDEFTEEHKDCVFPEAEEHAVFTYHGADLVGIPELGEVVKISVTVEPPRPDGAHAVEVDARVLRVEDLGDDKTQVGVTFLDQEQLENMFAPPEARHD